MPSHKTIRKQLIETDQTFRRLYEAHQRHERRLHELIEHASESSGDEIELKTLKIQKLHLKDEMEQIIRTRLDATAAP